MLCDFDRSYTHKSNGIERNFLMKEMRIVCFFHDNGADRLITGSFIVLQLFQNRAKRNIYTIL